MKSEQIRSHKFFIYEIKLPVESLQLERLLLLVLLVLKYFCKINKLINIIDSQKLNLRGLQYRSEMKFHSVTPCIYRQNKYVMAENERSSASLTRARIKSVLNFQPLYSLS